MDALFAVYNSAARPVYKASTAVQLKLYYGLNKIEELVRRRGVKTSYSKPFLMHTSFAYHKNTIFYLQLTLTGYDFSREMHKTVALRLYEFLWGMR